MNGTFGRMGDLPPNLRAALGIGDDNEENESAWPNPDIVARVLIEGLANYENNYEFQWGDVVQQKSGLEKYKHKGPYIFVRYLKDDEIVKNEGGTCDPESADCVVGIRTPSGGVTFVSVCQYRLEPWKKEQP